MSARNRLFAYYALLACCAGLFDTKNCAAQEMVTIEKYIEQNQNNFQRNPTSLRFVFLRCATLFFMVGGGLEKNSDPNVQAAGKKYFESGTKFLSAVAEVAKPFNEEFVVNQAKIMTAAYQERWDRAKALSGNPNDDPVIRSDTQTCWALYK
jgi:hypothetical protein